MATKKKVFTPDKTDVQILIRLNQRKSYEEIGRDLSLGISSVQYRINRMLTFELISKPQEQQARSIEVTQAGFDVLKAAGTMV